MIGLVFALAVLPADGSAESIHAGLEPYLSVRTGLACQACHTNRTGGGNRTMFGNIFAQTQLPMQPGTVVPKELTEFLRVGFDVRAEAQAAFRSTTTPRTEMVLDVAQLYIEGRFLDGRVVMYMDQTMGPTSSYSREAFVMVEALPGEGYVKAGRLLLPYGWRLQDDAEFIRARTDFNYFASDMGAEIGFAPGPLQFALALTNGTFGGRENDNGKLVTTQASLVFPNVRIGASASRNESGGPGVRRDTYGGFGGVAIGPLALLGEVDLRRDVVPAPAATIRHLFGYAEADWLFRRGLNGKVTYGYWDPDRAAPNDRNVRMRFGLEAFPVPFLRFGAFYTYVNDDNGTGITDDRLSAEAQIHF